MKAEVLQAAKDAAAWAIRWALRLWHIIAAAVILQMLS
ncbi:hypothetical protein Nitsa_1182 [Nitratifractor salsuginis DSM 16511]|uniref:Uncharacterized protein n=1 Tax=Nitratifractor salsuginis (strain DSM 16511 / JCM 12458 / E9I37-1) TaxID=749222 RepID=E6WYC3_NITSE|nr:hypothetical protein Nitsa_1182 [Nitratifractor salsuginis DSM 16511]